MHLMRTLQARIVVTTVTLLAVVCAVLGVGAAVALHHYLSAPLAQGVWLTVRFASSPPGGSAPPPRGDDDPSHRPPPPNTVGGGGGGDGTSRIQVRIKDGQVVT